MKSLLIVGADNLGGIPEKLTTVGFSEVLHLDGRKVQMVKKELPEKVNCILVLTDFVSHNLTSAIKKRAKSQSIPIYFAKRSWSSIYNALNRVG